MKFLGFYKKYLIFSTIVGLVGMSYMLHDEAVKDPAAALIQKELRVELDKIDPLPGAILIKTSDDHKSDHALVANSYNSTLTMDQIY